MSEEDENNSGGEENEEEEENEEGEEGEDDEEGEENEDEEGEEEEDDDEGEEEEDDEEGDSKKKKKKGNDSSKFEENKLVQSNEIQIDLPNTDETFTMANIDHPKSILTILDEINSEMETLSNQLSTTLSFIERKSIERENNDLQQVLNKAAQLTKEIELMESLDHNKENKCIQSDQGDNNYYHNTSHHSSPRNSFGNEIQPNNEPYVPMEPQRPYYPSYPNYQQKEQYPPYDPNRNIQYYNSLRNNMNNNYGNQMNMRGGGGNSQTARVRRMDELYQGRDYGMNNNRMPVIYSQNETGGSRTFGGEMHNRQDYSNLNNSFTRQRGYQAGRDNAMFNNNNNNYNNINMNNNNNYGGRPFERNRPGNISQAMDILLDK